MLRDASVIAIDPHGPSVDIQYRDNSEVQKGVKVAGRVYWNLQIDDYVIVGFISDEQSDPIVIDEVLVHGDPLVEDDKPTDPDAIKLLHTIKNTDGEVTGQIKIETDKDGNLTLELIGKLGSLNLKAMGDEGNINIEGAGALNITAPSGVTITSDGMINVNTKGDVAVDAGGKVTIDGSSSIELGDNVVKQLINNYPNCLFTGAFHAIGNKKVKV